MSDTLQNEVSSPDQGLRDRDLAEEVLAEFCSGLRGNPKCPAGIADTIQRLAQTGSSLPDATSVLKVLEDTLKIDS